MIFPIQPQKTDQLPSQQHILIVQKIVDFAIPYGNKIMAGGIDKITTYQDLAREVRGL